MVCFVFFFSEKMKGEGRGGCVPKREESLSVVVFGGEVFCDGDFPFITVREELLLVVEEFFVGFGRVFVVGTFDDGIDGARFLAPMGKRVKEARA